MSRPDRGFICAGHRWRCPRGSVPAEVPDELRHDFAFAPGLLFRRVSKFGRHPGGHLEEHGSRFAARFGAGRGGGLKDFEQLSVEAAEEER